MSAPSTAWVRVQELFARAVELAPEDRSGWLEAECGTDAALRREVETLLANDDDGFLIPLPTPDDVDPITRPDGRIGRYRLIRVLGEGGMGVVWLAERDDKVFHQQVALKVLKRGLDTELVLRRFREERQVLAELGHPNVARLLDGGATEDGRPYLVLEHVEGVPLDRYARALSLDERLRLFLKVCGAVEHAHRNLVVHRDLKPSNILVGADGEPKLLDFGIAKVLDVGRGPVTTLTQERPMTPQYASPEQLRGAPVTTASDVYGLGLLLYELIAERRPYELEGLDVAQRRLKVEGTRPPPPSAAGRVPMHKRSSADLDTIVAKALRPAPLERYTSARELADDVTRFLRGLPILARPDTILYRARMFARRNRLAVGAGAVALAGVIGGLIAGIVMYLHAEDARHAAEASEGEARWRAYVASLAAADAALSARRATGEARELLEGAEPELRGWEWEHLSARVDRSLWVAKLPGPGFAVAVRPGAPMVAVAGRAPGGAFVHLVDGLTGRTLARLEGCSERVRGLAFDPSGRVLAGASADGTVRVWDVETGATLATLPVTPAPVSVAFSPDGERLVVGADEGGGLRVFAAAAWRGGASAPLELTGPGARVWSVAFDPTGRRICAGTDDGGVFVWSDAALDWTASVDGAVRTVAFSREATEVLVGTDAASFRRLHAASGEVRGAFDGPPASWALAIAPKLDRVAWASQVTSGGTNRVLVTDTMHGEVRSELLGHAYPGGVWGVAFSADGERVATSSWERELRLWDADGSPASRAWRAAALRVSAIDGDDEVVAVGAADGTVGAFDVATGIALAEMEAVHEGATTGVALLAGEILASVGEDGRFVARELAGGRLCEVDLGAPVVAVDADLGLSGRGSDAAIGLADGRVLLVDRQGTVVEIAATHEPVRGLARSKDGRLAVLRTVSSTTGELAFALDILTPAGDASARVAIPTPCEEVVWLAGDETIAVAGLGNAIHLIDPARGSVRASFDRPPEGWRYKALAAEPGGRIVTANTERALRVGDPARAELVAALRTLEVEVTVLAFAGASGRLVGGDGTGRVLVWEVAEASAGVAASAARRAAIAHGDRASALEAIDANPWLADPDRDRARDAVLRLR